MLIWHTIARTLQRTGRNEPVVAARLQEYGAVLNKGWRSAAAAKHRRRQPAGKNAAFRIIIFNSIQLPAAALTKTLH
jgi:hypothetical protein